MANTKRQKRQYDTTSLSLALPDGLTIYRQKKYELAPAVCKLTLVCSCIARSRTEAVLAARATNLTTMPSNRHFLLPLSSAEPCSSLRWAGYCGSLASSQSIFGRTRGYLDLARRPALSSGTYSTYEIVPVLRQSLLKTVRKKLLLSCAPTFVHKKT